VHRQVGQVAPPPRNMAVTVRMHAVGKHRLHTYVADAQRPWTKWQGTRTGMTFGLGWSEQLSINVGQIVSAH